MPDEKRKGKMRTVHEMEYCYEPEMEGTPSTEHSTMRSINCQFYKLSYMEL